MARIKIVGFEDAKEIEDVFASCMVDVAYVDEVTTDAIYVTGDVGIDFEKREDFEWVKEVIEVTMAHEGAEKLEISLAKQGE